MVVISNFTEMFTCFFSTLRISTKTSVDMVNTSGQLEGPASAKDTARLKKDTARLKQKTRLDWQKTRLDWQKTPCLFTVHFI